MLQRLGIRGKLLAVVLVPVFVLVLAATYIVAQSATSYGQAANARSVVEAIERAEAAGAALQVERYNGANFVASVQDTTQKLDDAREATDERFAELVALAASSNPDAQGALEAANASLGKTPETALLEGPRALTVSAPADGEWLSFPAADDVLPMSIEYAQISDEILQLADVYAEGSDVKTALRALALQIRLEGDLASNRFTTPVPYMEAFIENQPLVDAALASLEGVVAEIPSSDVNDLPLEYFNAALGIRDGVATLRIDIAAGEAAERTVVGYYTSSIRALQSAAESTATAIPDPDTAVELQAYVAVDKLIERLRYEGVVSETLVRRGYYISGEADDVKTNVVASDLALSDARAAAAQVGDMPEVPYFGASGDGEFGNLVSFSLLRIGVQSGRDSRLVESRELEWMVQVEQEVDSYKPIRALALAEVKDSSQSAEQAAAIQVVVTGAVVLAGVVASVLIALLIARRIVNPLRRLTTTATAVRQELPRLVERVALPGQTVDVSEVQIPVESMDEVGRLAEAFNSVNAATLAIAAEQAALRGSISEMFINVARRDQVLLNRQLASIDEMERTQDDPDTLTKLFALDHLATRMRRNSESLLVLAGIDTGRRLRRAMPLSDVVRTASSEIELYERVQLELDADPAMLGHSALTAAHLFAELLENATVFSDPGSPVIVRTMATAGGFEVTISDSGIGMTVEELAEANARVASTAASEILGAQRLGLFVVGRIARRVGARVHLDSVEGEGTVATIVMPPTLFEAGSDPTAGHVSASVTDNTIHAPAALVRREDDLELPSIPVPVEAEISLPAADSRSMVVDVAEDEGPQSTGMERLVARDAAQAPMAEPVDLEALTEGVSGVGLPTRRRRAPHGAEAVKDTSSIIALPQRASDEQLSALSTAAASTGFTPIILAADEISPESAEQRSRVFRGFRPLRETDADGVDVPPDAESLGQAVRRGAFVADAGSSAGVASEAIPTLEPERFAAPGNASVADSILEEPPFAAQSATPSAFAVEPADPRDESEPLIGQDPRIASGFDPTQDLAGSSSQPELAGPLAVPSLEEDPFVEDEPRVLTPWGRAARAAATQEPVHEAAVAAPEYAEPPVQAMGWGSQEHAPAVQRTALYPAANAAWQSQPTVPQPQPDFVQDAVTSSPSLDQLILDGALDSGVEKGGFFGKLFGRGRKEGDDQDPQPAAPAVVPVHYEVDDPNPASGQVPQYMAPMSGEFAAPPTGEHFAVPYAEALPHTDPVPYNTAAQYHDPSAYNAAAQYHDAAQSHETAQSHEPVQYPSAYAPTPSFDDAVLSGPIPTQPVAHQFGEAFTPDLSVAPVGEQWSQYAAYGVPAEPPRPPALFDSSTGTFYSPDQLARPMGWETAGATALQEAAPEAEFGYHPVVDIAPEEPEYADEGDVASAVFSELSSLAAERPKVHKTRAGLVKREPVEIVPQVVAVVAEPSAPRDPDAVRARFSAFYTGTQRARSDVREFNESTQGSLTER